MSENLDRDQTLPPHSPRAEDAVLAAVIKSKGAVLDEIQPILAPNDFYAPDKGAIYREMVDLHSASKPVDSVLFTTLTDKQANIVADLDMHPLSAHGPHYARIVAEQATLREIISHAAKIAEAAFRDGANPAELLRIMDVEASRLAAGSGVIDPVVLPEAWIERVRNTVAARDSTSKLAGISWGFEELDRMTLGLRAGAVYMLAARTSVGKTQLGLQVAMNVADGAHVIYVTLEMSVEEMGERALVMASGLDKNRLATNRLAPVEREEMDSSLTEMQAFLGLAFVDDAVTVKDVADKVRWFRAKIGEPSLLVIDYLQLLEDGDLTGEAGLSAVSKAVKRLARRENIPVLSLAQFNREADKEIGAPTLSQLRGSGALEQDADVVIALHREAKGRQNELDIIMRKNRGAGMPRETGRKLFWDDEKNRYLATTPVYQPIDLPI